MVQRLPRPTKCHVRSTYSDMQMFWIITLKVIKECFLLDQQMTADVLQTIEFLKTFYC